MAALMTWLVGLPGPIEGSIGWANDGGPLALTLAALLLGSVLALYLMRDRSERRKLPRTLRRGGLGNQDATVPHAA